MAVLHQATLTPSKADLVSAWLPGRAWYDGTTERGPAGSFRLDDPEGQVGMEGFLLGSAGGSTLFVPLTYRPAPLPGADAHLLGTMEHSVLGTRWTYDACGDPVWAAALATAVLTGGTEAVEEIEVDGGVRRPRTPSVTVRGSGTPGTDVPPIDTVTCRDEGGLTVVDAGPLELVVVRRIGTEPVLRHSLTAEWAGGSGVVLAGLR